MAICPTREQLKQTIRKKNTRSMRKIQDEEHTSIIGSSMFVSLKWCRTISSTSEKTFRDIRTMKKKDLQMSKLSTTITLRIIPGIVVIIIRYCITTIRTDMSMLTTTVTSS